MGDLEREAMAEWAALHPNPGEQLQDLEKDVHEMAASEVTTNEDNTALTLDEVENEATSDEQLRSWQIKKIKHRNQPFSTARGPDNIPEKTITFG